MTKSEALSHHEQQLIRQNRSGYDGKYGIALPNKESALAVASIYLRSFIDARKIDAQSPLTIIDRGSYWLILADGHCGPPPTASDCGDGGIALRKIDGGIIFANDRAI